MTPLYAPVRWLGSLEWRRGFFEWARSDGVTWVYIFKVLFAAFLTLWLAMRLELPQPRTAMITVFIVMQRQNGKENVTRTYVKHRTHAFKICCNIML